MSRLVLTGARLLDPVTGVDTQGDVVCEGTAVVSAGPTGTARGSGDTVIDVAGCIVTPGLIDAHAHCFAGIGLADADSVGVDAAVTGVVDAGGVGALSFDDFLATTAGPARSAVSSILSIEAGGITHPSMQLNTHTALDTLVTSSIDDLGRVVEANRSRIVGLKVYAYGDAGVRWVRYAKAVANLIDVPLFVHVGELLPHRRPAITAETLDCSMPATSSPIASPVRMALSSIATGRCSRVWRPPAVAACSGTPPRADRNLSFARTRMALDLGWLPDTVSTDLHMFSVRSHARSLLYIMGGFVALGMSLPEVLRTVTEGPGKMFGLPVGSLRPGGLAELSVIRVVDEATEYVDADRLTLQGPCRLDPVGAVRGGAWHRADPAAAAAEANRIVPRAEPPVPEFDPEELRWRAPSLPVLVRRRRSREAGGAPDSTGSSTTSGSWPALSASAG